MLRLDLCDCSDAYIIPKGKISLTGDNAYRRNKKLTSRTMPHLSHAYQKSITHL